MWKVYLTVVNVLIARTPMPQCCYMQVCCHSFYTEDAPDSAGIGSSLVLVCHMEGWFCAAGEGEEAVGFAQLCSGFVHGECLGVGPDGTYVSTVQDRRVTGESNEREGDRNLKLGGKHMKRSMSARNVLEFCCLADVECGPFAMKSTTKEQSIPDCIPQIHTWKFTRHIDHHIDIDAHITQLVTIHTKLLIGQPQTYSAISLSMRSSARSTMKSVMNPWLSERTLYVEGILGKASN